MKWRKTFSLEVEQKPRNGHNRGLKFFQRIAIWPPACGMRRFSVSACMCSKSLRFWLWFTPVMFFMCLLSKDGESNVQVSNSWYLLAKFGKCRHWGIQIIQDTKPLQKEEKSMSLNQIASTSFGRDLCNHSYGIRKRINTKKNLWFCYCHLKDIRVIEKK